MPQYTSFEVELEDGRLHVGQWGPLDGRPVLVAAHGITATHMEFPALAEALGDEVTVVAPDLRGRGRSRDIGPPFSMAHHADDLAAVMDHLGVDRTLVLGHSMGGFVAVVMAHRHPDRVARLVLVDGGVPLAASAALLAQGFSTDELIRAVIGPAAERLTMTFESVDDYLDFWRPHPAIGGDLWNEHVRAYLEYDLIGEPPALRPTCTVEALRGDTADTIGAESSIPAALANLSTPTLFIRAQRGLFNEEPALYPDDYTREVADALPTLSETLVPDVNHYTILISEHGAEVVAELVRGELAQL